MNNKLLTFVVAFTTVLAGYAGKSGEFVDFTRVGLDTGESRRVEVEVRNTGDRADMIIEWDSKPSGWSITPKNVNPVIASGDTYTARFTVSAPATGTKSAGEVHSGRIVWKLYDDGFGRHPRGSTELDSYSQGVTAVEPDPPSIPSLRSPKNGYETRDSSVSLDWSDSDADLGLSEYEVQVDNRDTFSSPDFSARPTRSQVEVSTSSLLGGTDGTYYWRVRAKDRAGNYSRRWSSTRSFLVDDTAPTIPELKSPAYGAETSDSTVYLNWNRSSDSGSGMDEYKVQVADSPSFSSLEYRATRPSSNSSDTTSSLSDGLYYWRVRAEDDVGNESDWSSIWSFRVRTSPDTYRLTVNKGSGGGLKEVGSSVSITAGPPPNGQVFDEWTVSPARYDSNLGSAAAASTTFTMPAVNVTLTATYRVVLTTNRLTVIKGSGDGLKALGASVLITANAAPSGQEFIRWTVSPAQYASNLGSAVAASTTFTMPAVNVTLTATYGNIGGTGGTTISIVETSARPGSFVEVPIQMVASGIENGVSFTVSFNPEKLTFRSFSTTSSGSNENTTRAAMGEIGVLLTSSTSGTTPYRSGTQELARVSFDIIGGTSGDRIAVGFSDSLITRNVSPESITPSWNDGVILISAGIEADVMPKLATNEKVDLFDWIKVGRFAAKLDATSSPLEFQKADCAPRAARGDGKINLFDWIQAGRYAALLDPAQAAGGASSAVQGARVSNAEESLLRYTAADKVGVRETGSLSEVFVEDISAEAAGSMVTASVYLVASGMEAGVTFSLSNTNLVYIGHNSSFGPHITTHDISKGNIGVSIAMSGGKTFSAGTNSLVDLHYTVRSDARSISTVLAFTDDPIAMLIAAVDASSIPFRFTDGSLTIGGAVPPMWMVTPDSAEYAGEATNGSFIVTQEPGTDDAPWTARLSTEAQGWVTLTPSYSRGTGDGEVRYTVSSNTTGAERSGTILVQNARFQMRQAALPPTTPANPGPADGAVDVDREVTLSWNADYATGYEVSFGTSASALQLAARLGSTSYHTGMRAAGMRFLWRVTAMNEAGMTTGGLWSFTTVDTQTPGEVFGRNGAEWSHAGAMPWFAQSSTVRSGTSAMQSGPVDNGETSTLEAALVGPGRLEFWWRVDSEENMDYLSFHSGTNMAARISGSVADWTNEVVRIPSGVHTVRWSYEKNASGVSGADAGWLDDVQWQGENRTTYPLSGFEEKWMAAYLWDYTAKNWIVLNHPVKSPTELTVRNIRPNQWYWLCVMEYEGSNWNLVHGSWISHRDQEEQETNP